MYKSSPDQRLVVLKVAHLGEIVIFSITNTMYGALLISFGHCFGSSTRL